MKFILQLLVAVIMHILLVFPSIVFNFCICSCITCKLLKNAAIFLVSFYNYLHVSADPAGCELIPKITETVCGTFRVEYLPCGVGKCLNII